MALPLALSLVACGGSPLGSPAAVAPSAPPSYHGSSPAPEITSPALTPDPTASASPTPGVGIGSLQGQIAYVAGADPQIHLLDLATGESRQLTNLGLEDAEPSASGWLQPVISCFTGPSGLAWSPDGTQLAFSYGGCDSVVHVVDLEGNLRRIADGGGPAWSPDGRLLAFSPNVPWMPCGNCQTAPFPGAYDLHLVDLVAGGEPWPLTRNGASFTPGLASFSPDGSLIAHTGPLPADAAETELFEAAYVTAVDGSESALVRVGAWPVGWLPDGRLVVVDERTSEMAAVDVATRREMPIVPGHALHAISSDGRLVVEWASDPETGENLLRMWTSAGDQLAELPGTFGGWSPDGSHLAVLHRALAALLVLDATGAVVAELPIVGSATPFVAWRPGS